VWLNEKMIWILRDFYCDLEIKNNLKIKFGRKAKQRLGSIKRREVRNRLTGFLVGDKNPDSIITITGYFRDESIPDYVIYGTIGHELAHYAHGFSSPLPQIYDHPHRGKVIQRELIKRGMGDIHYTAEKWLKHNWVKFVKENM